MRFPGTRRLAVGVLLIVLTGSCGCGSLTTEGGGLSLSGQGAPPQWEPEIEETDMAAGDSDH